MQASEARQVNSHAVGVSPGPKGYLVDLSSETEEDDEHLVTDAEAGEARAAQAKAAEAAAACKFGGPDHPEPLYMPGTYSACSLVNMCQFTLAPLMCCNVSSCGNGSNRQIWHAGAL